MQQDLYLLIWFHAAKMLIFKVWRDTRDMKHSMRKTEIHPLGGSIILINTELWTYLD